MITKERGDNWNVNYIFDSTFFQKNISNIPGFI